MKFNVPTENKNNSGVYIIRNSINDMVYIGGTTCFFKRFTRHLYHLRKNKHINSGLQELCNTYGVEVLSFDLLEVLNDKPANDIYRIEHKHIKRLTNYDQAKGYNVSSPIIKKSEPNRIIVDFTPETRTPNQPIDTTGLPVFFSRKNKVCPQCSNRFETGRNRAFTCSRSCSNKYFAKEKNIARRVL